MSDYVKADNDERDFQKYLMEDIVKNSIRNNSKFNLGKI